MRLWQEGLEEERRLDCSKQNQSEYRALIKEQMRIKAEERHLARIKSQQELQDLREKEQMHKARVDQVLSDKMKELKLSRVPDNLIKDVERRIKREAS